MAIREINVSKSILVSLKANKFNMAQIIQRGNELIRINTQKNTIESSIDGGRSWHNRFTSSFVGCFEDLFDNGSEILGCTSKGTYHYIARDIVPRLKAFKALDKHGYEPDFKDIDAWNKAIQKMIDAFELVGPNKVVYSDDYPVINEGLDLFRKYFLNLWD